MCLEDMAPYSDGSIDVKFPPNMAIFISPGYLADYAWLKINDPYFAAATLAAGRTVGHPAQSAEGVGEEKYVALYNPFIIGKKANPADRRSVLLSHTPQAKALYHELVTAIDTYTKELFEAIPGVTPEQTFTVLTGLLQALREHR